MAKPIVMPQVGQDIETGVIVEWCVKENDEIKKGDIVAIVESDKATFEVEAYESGTLLKTLYKAGDEAKVLEPIAYIGEPGEKIEEPQVTTAAKAAGPTAEPKSDNKTEQTAQSGISVSPSAKRIARERRIDLTKITGSGPGGRITKQDVLAAAGPGTEEQTCTSETQNFAAGDKELPFSKMRKRIAQRLTLSKQTIPHFYLFLDVDMTAACRWRAKYNKKEAEIKITFNDMIVKAAALALTEFRQLNAHVGEDKLILRKDINIGVAVAVDDGLIVPVIPDADRKDIQQINRISRENTEGAKKGVLKVQSVGTFTVSNLGMHSINGFLPIINPPECAILGIGNISKRAVVLEDSSVGARDVMTLALACDHRAVDGTNAAQFLNTIKDNLENFKCKCP